MQMLLCGGESALASLRREGSVGTMTGCFFFFQAEDGIRDADVTGVQTCALPICPAAAGPLLESLAPFDVYAGAQLPGGMRRVALRFRFRHASRALTDAEVDAAMEKVIRAVRDAGYAIRA